MAVLFDSNILLLMLQPGVPPPIDPSTSAPVAHVQERIDYLIRRLSREKTSVLLPTPVIAEILCKAGTAKTQYIQNLQKEPFRVVPFDLRAAIECADLLAFPLGKKGVPGMRAEIKFDRQIVSIAKTQRVETIYSDDKGVFREAGRVGLRVVRSFELERDPEATQGKLEFDLSDPKAGIY